MISTIEQIEKILDDSLNLTDKARESDHETQRDIYENIACQFQVLVEEYLVLLKQAQQVQEALAIENKPAITILQMAMDVLQEKKPQQVVRRDYGDK